MISQSQSSIEEPRSSSHSSLDLWESSFSDSDSSVNLNEYTMCEYTAQLLVVKIYYSVLSVQILHHHTESLFNFLFMFFYQANTHKQQSHSHSHLWSVQGGSLFQARGAVSKVKHSSLKKTSGKRCSGCWTGRLGFPLWWSALHLAEVFSSHRIERVDVQPLNHQGYQCSSWWTCWQSSCDGWPCLAVQLSTLAAH